MHAPVNKLICKLAVPTIITMMISAMYNMADTYFVSWLGTSAIGGVGIVFPLMLIIQAFGFMFGQGSGNYVSRKLGARQLDDAARMASTGFFSAFIGGTMIAVIGTTFRDEFVTALGATETIRPHAAAYMTYILCAAPFMTSSLTLNNILRYQGSSFYGMIGMVSGAVVNIFLDPVLIFVFDMGVAGAAIATGVSQMIGLTLLLIGCTKGGNLRIRFRDFSPRISVYIDMFRGGIPSLVRQGVMSVAGMLINRFAAEYGDAAVASMSIVQRVAMMANSAVIGFNQGYQPVCGFNFGAKNYDRVKQAFFFTAKVGTGILLTLCAVGLVFAPQIIGIFRKDPDVLEIGSRGLRLLCCGMYFTGPMMVCNMTLQTMGYPMSASFIPLARQGLFLIPLLFLIVPRFGLVGLQTVLPLTDFLAFAVAVPLMARAFRSMENGDKN